MTQNGSSQEKVTSPVAWGRRTPGWRELFQQTESRSAMNSWGRGSRSLKEIRFDRMFAPLILQGIKTQTRRPVFKNEEGCRFGQVGDILTWFYSEHNRAPKIHICLRLTRIWQEPLKAISADDLIKEGNLSKTEFFTLWDHFYKKSSSGDSSSHTHYKFSSCDNPLVHVLEFERVRPYTYFLMR